MEAVKRQNFIDQLGEISEKKAGNSRIMTTEKHQFIVDALRRISESGAAESRDYRIKARYDLLQVENSYHLVKKGTELRFVVVEEVFDIIATAHSATNHGGRDVMLKDISKRYANISRDQVMHFIALCDECRVKRRLDAFLSRSTGTNEIDSPNKGKLRAKPGNAFFRSAPTQRRCVVAGCDVRAGQGIPLYEFPMALSDWPRRFEWLRILGLMEADLNSKSCVCRTHFEPGFVTQNPPYRLQKDAVPTLSIPNFPPPLKRKRSEPAKVVAPPTADDLSDTIPTVINKKKKIKDTQLTANSGDGSITSELVDSFDQSIDSGPEIKISILDYCRRIITENYQHGEDACCAKCGQVLNFWIRFGVSTTAVLSHAVSHTTLPLYRCRYCDFASSTNDGVVTHLKSSHSWATISSTHIIDMTEQFRDAVLNMVISCFAEDSGSAFPSTTLDRIGKSQSTAEVISAITVSVQPDAKDNIVSTEMVSNNSAKNDSGHIGHAGISSAAVVALKAEGHDIALQRSCRYYIDKNFACNQEFQCNLCHETFARTGRRDATAWEVRAFDHALTHLTDNRRYTCRECDYGDDTVAGVCKHLRKDHGSSDYRINSKYVDLTKIYLENIRDTIRLCYDEKVPKIDRLTEQFESTNQNAADDESGFDSPKLDDATRDGIAAISVVNLNSEPIDHEELNKSFDSTPAIGLPRCLQSERIRNVAFVQFRRLSEKVFKCSKCGVSTKHRKLLDKHFKCFHSI